MAIIRELTVHFGVESDDALASRIGVAKSTIATWRRRWTISSSAAHALEQELRFSLSAIGLDGKGNLSKYLLRQAFYFFVSEITGSSDWLQATERAELADQLAIIEPFLKCAITRAAAAVGYEGVRGATSFLLNLRSGKMEPSELMAEALADRRRDLAEKGEG